MKREAWGRKRKSEAWGRKRKRGGAGEMEVKEEEGLGERRGVRLGRRKKKRED